MKEKKYIYLIPTGICLLVALVQLALTMNTPLSRWKLGGFGMFSSISHRVLHVTTFHQGMHKTVVLGHKQLDSERERFTQKTLDSITNFPTDHSLNNLKDLLLHSRFISHAQNFKYIPSDQGIFFQNGKAVKIPTARENETFLGKKLFANLNIKVYQATYNKEKQLIAYELLKEKNYDL